MNNRIMKRKYGTKQIHPIKFLFSGQFLLDCKPAKDIFRDFTHIAM